MATIKTPADVKDHITKVVIPRTDRAINEYSDVKKRLPPEIAKLEKALANKDADLAQLTADAMENQYLKNAELALGRIDVALEAIAEITKSRVDYSQDERVLDAQLARIKKPKLDLDDWIKTGNKLVSDAGKFCSSTVVQEKAAFAAWAHLVARVRLVEERLKDREKTAQTLVQDVKKALNARDGDAPSKAQAKATPLVKPLPGPFEDSVKVIMQEFARKYDGDLIKKGPNARQVEQDEKEINDLIRSGEAARLQANDMLSDVIAAKI